MEKSAKVYDYQARAREFKVNDWVVPFGANPLEIGRITQIWPGIAQADVEFSLSSIRFPIEDLRKVNKDKSKIVPPETCSIPGGKSLTNVSAGPEAKETVNQGLSTYHPTMSKKAMSEMASRVALYWHKSDRNYRATKTENATGKFCCPKKGCTSALRKAVYKRREGKSDHLYVCPQCLFMVKDLNIHRDTEQAPPEMPPSQLLPQMPMQLPEHDQIFIHEIMAGAEELTEKKATDIESWTFTGIDLSASGDVSVETPVEVSFTPTAKDGDLHLVLAGSDTRWVTVGEEVI